MEKTWLDVVVFRCPHCGGLYAESSWYAIELESDIDCNRCGKTFGTRKAVVDRVLLRFGVERGRIQKVEVADHLTEE